MFSGKYAYEQEKLVAAQIETICLGPLDVNCYIVGCPEHMSCAVFDPGDSAARILGTIENAKWSVANIINTHGHADHTGANHKLASSTQAPLSIHRLDRDLLTNHEMKEMAGYLGLAPSPEPDILLEDGDDVAVCECISFKVIHTPGHSPGGACFHHADFVISGDTIFRMSIGRSDLPGGNHETLIRSIRDKLFSLPDDTRIFPGHGDPTTIGYEKKNNPFVMNAFFR
ncbi:MAG: MBL fold metallo-hydrolase [Nitrospinota bacterium]|nr:MBL fold metallo-hydrolase [Nitrospinota bacterium]